jgi:hypothetical protein
MILDARRAPISIAMSRFPLSLFLVSVVISLLPALLSLWIAWKTNNFLGTLLSADTYGNIVFAGLGLCAICLAESNEFITRISKEDSQKKLYQYNIQFIGVMLALIFLVFEYGMTLFQIAKNDKTISLTNYIISMVVVCYSIWLIFQIKKTQQ